MASKPNMKAAVVRAAFGVIRKILPVEVLS